MHIYIKDPVQKVTIDSNTLSYTEVKYHFEHLSEDILSFLGMVTNTNEVLRFLWVSQDRWILDHPVIPSDLHRQRYASKEECISFIEKVYQEYDVSTYKDFVEVPVQEFTLDEVLAFKKEDEALLNEEEIPTKVAPTPVTVPEPVTKKSKTNQSPSMIMGAQIGINKNSKSPTPPIPKKSTSKPVQQIASAAKKEATPSKAKSIVEKTIKKASKPSNDDNSFFSI